jgi:hypothetical protein
MASVSSITEFVPTIGGNDTRTEDDPKRFSVKLKAVSVSKRQNELRKFVNADPKKLAKDMMSDDRTSEIKKLLAEHFVRFVNLYRKNEVLDTDATRDIKVQLIEGVAADKVDLKTLEVGTEYFVPMTLDDCYDMGELELLMECFMYLVGSSQLKPADKRKKKDGSGDDELTVDDEREDEEKNSESLSGTTRTH